MVNLNEKLRGVNTVAITGHVRPDGDCIGSCLGFYNYIIDNFPEVSVDLFLEQPGSEFNYLKNIDKVKTEITDTFKKYDIFVVFDCGAIDRFEPFRELLGMSDLTICIDHHMTNDGFARENFVIPDLSSTCELLYTCLDDSMISKSTAECLYTGIICDTGIFKYQCTTSETMRIAGKLMDKGINHTHIIDDGFYMKSHAQNQITGRVLLESKLILDGKCIYGSADKSTMDYYGLDGKKMGGVIDQLRNTEGTEVAIFMYELTEGFYKVSMRSKDYIDVSRICSEFGGGGHVRAAGCSIKGNPDYIIGLLKEQLIKQFKEFGDK